MDENTLYKLGPKVGLIPCKTKDQKFWNSSVYFMLWLTDNFTPPDIVAIIKLLCSFIAEDGTGQSTSNIRAILEQLSVKHGSKLGQDASRRFDKLIKFNILQTLLPNELPNELTSITNSVLAHPSLGSRCDDIIPNKRAQQELGPTANNTARKKKVKKPVNAQRAEDAKLVREIFSRHYLNKFHVPFTNWNGKAIGQCHAYMNKLRLMFALVDRVTVEMMITGYFNDQASWCGDAPAGSVKGIGYMATDENVQCAFDFMKRAVVLFAEEFKEEWSGYGERLAAIRGLSGPRETANGSQEGDSGRAQEGGD